MDEDYWHRVAGVGDLEDGKAMPVELMGLQLALYNVKSAWFCTDNVCSHAFALLTDGWLEGYLIECPLHSGQYSGVALRPVLMGGRMTNVAFTMLTAAGLDALGITVPPQGTTALRCFGLVGSFDRGIALLRTIALDTTYLKLEGGGQVDFGHETLAFKLKPMAQISGSSVAVPVVVEGPFHAVHGRLDADGLDKLGLFIDGLFGGDRSTACSDAGLLPAPALNANPD